MNVFVLFAVEGVSFVDVHVFSYFQDTFNTNVISLTIQTNRSCAAIMATQIVFSCLDHQYIAYFIKPNLVKNDQVIACLRCKLFHLCAVITITVQTMDLNS